MSTEQEQHNWYKRADDWVGEIYADLLEAGHDLPPDVEMIAVTLADVTGAETTDWSTRRSPQVIATGCLYIADTIVRGEDRMTQRELGDTAPVTAVGVRNHYHDIPEVFLENASEVKRRRLGEKTVAYLEMFRDAERAGFGLANVDPDEHEPTALRDLADRIERVRGVGTYSTDTDTGD